MPPAVVPSLFARLTRRRPRSMRRPEPADMGTAFGMEQWLDERDHASPQAAPLPARRSWWPRWLHASASR